MGDERHCSRRPVRDLLNTGSPDGRSGGSTPPSGTTSIPTTTRRLIINLYTTRNEAVEHEIIRPLVVGLEDLLADGGAVDDYFDIDAIANETIIMFITEGGMVTYCLSADIYPDLFWEIVDKHAR